MKHAFRNISLALLIAAMSATPMTAAAQGWARNGSQSGAQLGTQSRTQLRTPGTAQSATGPIQQRQQIHLQDRLTVRQGVTLNGRAGPGTQYQRLQALQSGTELKLLAQQRGWAQVEAPDGQQLWVSSRYLNCDGSCAAQAGTPMGRGPADNR